MKVKVRNITGDCITELEFFHAERLLNIDPNFEIVDKAKYYFDGKEIVKVPKKKAKDKSKETDK